MIDIIESNYSKPDHRKVVRKKPESNQHLPNLDSLMNRLLLATEKSIDKVITEVREDMACLRKGLQEGKSFNGDKLVTLLQMYGRRLGVSSDIAEIDRELELEEARIWLNTRIFTSSTVWSTLNASALNSVFQQIADRSYTTIAALPSELESKESELLTIVKYWLDKQSTGGKNPGTARANRHKFAGVGVGDLNKCYGHLDSTTKAMIADVSCKVETTAEADSFGLMGDNLKLMLEKVKLDEKSRSSNGFLPTKAYLANSLIEAMKSLNEDSIGMTEDDVVNFMGIGFFWLTVFMAVYRGNLTTLLWAPILFFVPMIYRKVEANAKVREIYDAIGVRIFFANHKKALLWLMDCVIVRLLFILIALVVLFIADQYKLLHDDGFMALWEKLIHYSVLLQKNCMVYCGNGYYFPIQKQVEDEQIVLCRNGIFYLNGVKYVQTGGPIRRIQVLKVRHRKSGVNRHKKSISSEVMDTNGTVYTDKTDFVSFRQIAKDMIMIMISAVGGDVKPRANPDYYADLVNRWKVLG